MFNNSNEYSILLERYNKILNSKYWKKTEKIRKFIDRFRKSQTFKPGHADSFTSLLNSYDNLNNSTFWRISEPLRKISKFNINEQSNDLPYVEWIKKFEKETEIEHFLYHPLISIIVPVFNTNATYLSDCVNSVFNQIYTNYELIIVNDHSQKQETLSELSKYKNKNNVFIIDNENSPGISNALNTGLQRIKGDYVCFLDHDDTLSKNALYEIVKAINANDGIQIIYSDEDKIDQFNNRYAPVFKPDFSPNRLLNDNYICHLMCIKNELIQKIGYFNSEYDGAQDYDYILRACELCDYKNIHHISKVLYHWRMIEGSTALSLFEKPYVVEATKKVKQQTILRRKYNAYLDEGNNIVFNLDKDRFISIIIPSKDNFEVLKRCVDSLLNCVKDIRHEIIVVDNGSCDENREMISLYLKGIDNSKYIYDPCEFNYSKMCNIGVENSNGDILLFLNDDVEITNTKITEIMGGCCCLEKVGAVGIKMYYPESTLIQHCGVVNSFPGPSHCLSKFDDAFGYNHNYNRIVNNVIAVTGACMMIEKKLFNEVGGFDEDFDNNFNDTELCFRLHKAGYYNVVYNNIHIYHHESFTRKEIDLKESLFEAKQLYDKHPDMYLYDPYYNVNFQLGSNNFMI